MDWIQTVNSQCCRNHFLINIDVVCDFTIANGITSSQQKSSVV